MAVELFSAEKASPSTGYIKVLRLNERVPFPHNLRLGPIWQLSYILSYVAEILISGLLLYS